MKDMKGIDALKRKARHAQRPRGKWVIVKQRNPFNPEFPWKVILWGGNGEHRHDGSEFATWREAQQVAMAEARAYRWSEYSDHRYQVHFEKTYLC